MPYLLVALVAAVAGGAVAAFTIRRGLAVAGGPTWTEPPSEPAPGPESPSGHAARDLPSAPTWQSRLTGAVGLVIAVLVGAGLIAGVCYATWAALRRAFS